MAFTLTSPCWSLSRVKRTHRIMSILILYLHIHVRICSGMTSSDFDTSNPVVLSNINKVIYSVLTKHQYIFNSTYFWPYLSVLANHLQANIYYMEVHEVCTYIMGSHGVYIKSCQFKNTCF
jgi:hypothetical protein